MVKRNVLTAETLSVAVCDESLCRSARMTTYVEFLSVQIEKPDEDRPAIRAPIPRLLKHVAPRWFPPGRQIHHSGIKLGT